MANMWKDHYSSLLNSVNNSMYRQRVESALAQVAIDKHTYVTAQNVKDAINNLEASGPDGLSGEALNYADLKLCVLLSMCFGAWLVHGKLPKSLMEVILVPVVKNKCGNLTDKNNYLPIAIATVVSKLFEFVLLERIKGLLGTSDNQFGFKSEQSTDMCIYLLKETIDYYKRHNNYTIR